MKRHVDFRWRLRETMAAHGYWKTTDLVPLLAERGIELSPSQVFRLVTQSPERLSIKTLAALCDILSCEPGDLIECFVVERSRTKSAAGGSNVSDLNASDGNAPGRPRRARITET